jgi:hypothetical protein
MKLPIAIFTVFFLASFFIMNHYLNSIYSNGKMDGLVLADRDILRQPTATPSPTPTLTPTPTYTPTPTPTPTNTPTPTITPTPGPVSIPSQLEPLFQRFASEYNVDKQLLVRIALCESGFNTLAINGDYLGLFQFGTTRWIEYRTQMGHDTNPDLRKIAEESIKTAAFAISRGKLFLWPNCVF